MGSFSTGLIALRVTPFNIDASKIPFVYESSVDPLIVDLPESERPKPGDLSRVLRVNYLVDERGGAVQAQYGFVNVEAARFIKIQDLAIGWEIYKGDNFNGIARHLAMKSLKTDEKISSANSPIILVAELCNVDIAVTHFNEQIVRAGPFDKVTPLLHVVRAGEVINVVNAQISVADMARVQGSNVRTIETWPAPAIPIFRVGDFGGTMRQVQQLIAS